jgi:hypothetical protein
MRGCKIGDSFFSKTSNFFQERKKGEKAGDAKMGGIGGNRHILRLSGKD